MSAYNVALVGATGAVGAEFLQLLETRDFPLGQLRLLASSRSAGTTIRFKDQDIVVEELTESSFKDIDIAFFSAGGSRSKQYAAAAIAAGAVVVDNSSAFRMDPSVPLVVPEVNPDALTDHNGIIANPNCSTILLVMVLAPLLKLAPIRRVVVSTYQAASGAGAAAMRELETQTAAILAGNAPEPEIFPHPIAFNLFSHNTAIDETGYNEEELKMVKETRKILSDDSVFACRSRARTPKASILSLWASGHRWLRFKVRLPHSRVWSLWMTARQMCFQCLFMRVVGMKSLLAGFEKTFRAQMRSICSSPGTRF